MFTLLKVTTWRNIVDFVRLRWIVGYFTLSTYLNSTVTDQMRTYGGGSPQKNSVKPSNSWMTNKWKLFMQRNVQAGDARRILIN